MDLVEVYVSGIAVDQKNENPVVLLESKDGEGSLPIWIGPAEATSIYTSLSGKKFERPMTHDLMRIIIDVLEAKVSKVEVTGIKNDTYFARIVMRRNGEIYYIDARPSDSIALALRTNSSIYVDKEVFDKYKKDVNVEGGKKDEDGEKGDDFGDLGL